MSTDKKNKVKDWLQNAVERVRDFAYTEPHAAEHTRQPLVGVALGGGFARGIAHLGVLRVLEEEHIPVSFIAGTSAGAMLAIAYASGHPIHEIVEQARATRFKDFGNWKLSWLGLASNQKLAHYPRKFLGVSTFEELRIPLAIAATDLSTGEPIYFTGGPLGPALRASCAYPGMFVPVEFEGRTLVDGFLAARRLTHLDRFAIERLRRNRTAVADVEPDLRARCQHFGQIDDDAVLSDDAKVQESSEIRRIHTLNVHRLRELQGQRAGRLGSNLQFHPRIAVDPDAIGIELNVDIVREHVEVEPLVLGIEPAARGEFLRRGIDRDVAAALAIEEVDVFGFAARACVRQGAKPFRPKLGDHVAERRRQRPAILADVAEIELKRPGNEIVEDACRGPEIRRVHGSYGSLIADTQIDALLTQGGGPNERCGE